MKKIILSCILVFCIWGCSSNDAEISKSNENVIKETNDSASSEKEQIENEPVQFVIGDQIVVNNDSGEYLLSIDGIKETNDRNSYSDTEANRVIIIDYSYENISVKDELNIFDSHFKAYDSEGNLMNTYPVSVDYAGGVGVGRKTKGQMAYALNDDNNHVELEYFDNMFNSKKDCLIVLEW